MFQLVKVWVDQALNPQTVEVRYTWSPLGGPPNWDAHEEAEVMAVVPNSNPTTRRAVLEIPRYVDGSDHYTLHYRFGGGGEHMHGYSPIFSEEIVAREIPYIDHEGKITEARVLWGVDGWIAPNWSRAQLEGLALRLLGDSPGYDAEGEGLADEAIYELVQTVALPRRYVAKVWAPRGATVEYVFQLLRMNSPVRAEDFERWDNNQGRNYRVTMS